MVERSIARVERLEERRKKDGANVEEVCGSQGRDESRSALQWSKACASVVASRRAPSCAGSDQCTSPRRCGLHPSCTTTRIRAVTPRKTTGIAALGARRDDPDLRRQPRAGPAFLVF